MSVCGGGGIYVCMHVCDRETSIWKYDPTDKLFQRDGSERAVAHSFPREREISVFLLCPRKTVPTIISRAPIINKILNIVAHAHTYTYIYTRALNVPLLPTIQLMTEIYFTKEKSIKIVFHNAQEIQTNNIDLIIFRAIDTKII